MINRYRVPEHIWRTNDGRLVLTGDPDARILAYARGDEFTEEDARRRGILDAVAGRQAKDKALKPAVKPGLTINRAKEVKTDG